MTDKQRIRVIADWLQLKGYYLSDKYALKFAKENHKLLRSDIERKLKMKFGY